MEILVAYASRHGATKGIAERIAETLAKRGLDVTMKHVDDVGIVEAYEAFVIGSAAYMGHWEKDATEFVRRHALYLASRPVWLFSSGPVGTDRFDAKGRDQIEAARPHEFAEFPELIQPREQKVFFGAYDPEREGGTFVERLVMKVPAIREAMPAGDFRDWPAIEAWADAIATEVLGLEAAVAAPA